MYIHNDRRRVEFGLISTPYTEVSDEELQSLISEFRAANPDVGVSMATGILRSRGYRVKRG